jgi:hypothetical protein
MTADADVADSEEVWLMLSSETLAHAPTLRAALDAWKEADND